MIEKGRFNDFNTASRRPLGNCSLQSSNADFVEALKDKSFAALYPKITKLLTETTAFYEEHFRELQSHIKREKRKLEFETPNRALVTHEYTLQDATKLLSGQYFLFNTASRLAWLKIYQEGKHICIASKQEVCDKLKGVLGDEVRKLSALTQLSEDELLAHLYEHSDGKPCFISFEKTNVDAPLLKLEYFDSLEKVGETKGVSLFNPIIQKEIEYSYRPVHGECSCWLYVKAPKDFHVDIKTEGNVDNPKSQDQEIYTAVWRDNGERTSVTFDTKIIVPDSLKLWYKGIYWVSGGVAILIAVLLTLNLSDIECNVINRIIANIPKGIYALVAALITTRGWLMREEYCLGKLSKAYTFITFSLIIEAILLSACDTSVKQRDTHELPARIICTCDTSVVIKKDSVSQDTCKIVFNDTIGTSLHGLK